ncbi:hypothetical protein KSC_100850 [Ktedonobacter sp. SOSP1-52]|nr:hypothetical protein KSC_100850 [Ktedonobacter sp. SOSP1-52]
MNMRCARCCPCSFVSPSVCKSVVRDVCHPPIIEYTAFLLGHEKVDEDEQDEAATTIGRRSSG